MYCSNCGTPNQEAARFCEKCGTALGASAPPSPPPGQTYSAGSPPPPPPQGPPPPPRGFADPRMRGPGGYSAPRPGPAYATGKNPTVATLLSFFIPGVGQFYNGDGKKGGLMLGGEILSWFLAAFIIGVFGMIGIRIWSMIDAYKVASGTAPTW